MIRGRDGDADGGDIDAGFVVWRRVSQEDHDALITRVEAQTSDLASLQTAQEAPTRTVKPAEQISIAEVSRHASDIPDSANYTLYDNGSSWSR